MSKYASKPQSAQSSRPPRMANSTTRANCHTFRPAMRRPVKGTPSLSEGDALGRGDCEGLGSELGLGFGGGLRCLFSPTKTSVQSISGLCNLEHLFPERTTDAIRSLSAMIWRWATLVTLLVQRVNAAVRRVLKNRRDN